MIPGYRVMVIVPDTATSTSTSTSTRYQQRQIPGTWYRRPGPSERSRANTGTLPHNNSLSCPPPKNRTAHYWLLSSLRPEKEKDFEFRENKASNVSKIFLLLLWAAPQLPQSLNFSFFSHLPSCFDIPCLEKK